MELIIIALLVLLFLLLSRKKLKKLWNSSRAKQDNEASPQQTPAQAEQVPVKQDTQSKQLPAQTLAQESTQMTQIDLLKSTAPINTTQLTKEVAVEKCTFHHDKAEVRGEFSSESYVEDGGDEDLKAIMIQMHQEMVKENLDAVKNQRVKSFAQAYLNKKSSNKLMGDESNR